MKVLLLGGTTEASAIARGLAAMPGIEATLSLAGRTRSPLPPPIPHRRGGFGGVDGLLAYLRAQAIDVLVDATHPFAARISANAQAAAAAAGIARLLVIRPPWQAQPGDHWQQVADMPAAAAALGPRPRRVFLTVGQQELAPFASAPWHAYLIRSVEPPDPARLPPTARCITARGPFDEAAERALLAEQKISIIVTKNSGGSATVAKLAAARALGLTVVMVRRPPDPPGPSLPDAAQALDWLRAHAAASAPRGV